jgi:hypothetical protein
MTSIADLKKTLEQYVLIKSRHINPSIIAFIDELIVNIKQTIFNSYVWTEEDIIKKINDDKNPDAIAEYFV